MFHDAIIKGGFVWMLPIISLSFVALAFCLERMWFWILQYLISRKEKEKEVLKKIFTVPFDRKKASEFCKDSKDIVLKVISTFLSSYEEFTLDIAERKANLKAEEEIGESKSFVDLLSFIASISGSLGLLGTVVGISIAFEAMLSSDARGLMAALSTALFTTVAGLFVYIPTYLCVFTFNKLSDRMEFKLETNIENLKNFLEFEEKSKLVFKEDENGQVEKISKP